MMAGLSASCSAAFSSELVECCQTAVDPLVDLGVLDACGLHKGAYLADCCEQIGFGTRELDLNAVVGGHAAVLAHVVDKARDGLKLLGEDAVIIVSVQRNKGVRYREGGMSTGDKAFDDIHGFGNGRAQACEGIDELLLGIHNGPFDGSILLGENIRDAFSGKNAKYGSH